jgi:AcrR family transcriptional regulator
MATGRPREFDTDEALGRAMEVFWRQGYEGTALSDLTEAMGINRPSLYAAFGNKESLFRKVLERYSDERAVHIRESLEEPTARAVAEHLMRGAVDATTARGCPKGCLTVQGALASGEQNEDIRKELAAWRRAGEARLRNRFKSAQAEGDLPAHADPADLARYVTSIVQGISVQATGGAARRELHRVVDIAMAGWPT